MKIRVNIVQLGFFACLLYVLMRPFISTYITPYYKYVFILLMILGTALALVHKSVIKRIGTLQFILCLLFYLYAILNAYRHGGTELLNFTLERYIFYTIPLFAFAFYGDKINWESCFKFISWFGVVDSAISIFEFLTKRQLFPMASGKNSVELTTMSGAKILRTYGLQGNYFLLAEILCVCGIAALYIYYKNNSKIYFAAFLFITVGILSSGSRGYYVSYAVAVAFFYLYITARKGMTVSDFVRFLIIAVLAAALLFFVFYTRINTGIGFIDSILKRVRMITDWQGDSANSSRIDHWVNAINRWKQSPLFGKGACSTDTRYSGYVAVTESGILKRLVELGIVGTALQYLTMFAPLVKGIKKLRKDKTRSDRIHAPFFLAVIVCFLVEDIVLQRYTALEYTVIIWTSISVIAYSEGVKAPRLEEKPAS